MVPSKLLQSNWLLFIQGLIAAIFFLIGWLVQKPIADTLLIRQIDPFLTATVPSAFTAYFAWLTLTTIIFIVFSLRKDLNHFAKNSDAIHFVFLQIIISFILLTRCLQFPIAYDDSYIDYRYVHNLVQYASLDYNPGQHVMGFTSHLHLFLLSALSKLLHYTDIAFLSQQINVFCQATGCVMLYKLLSDHLKTPWAALGCALFAVDPYLITECAYGKETSIVVLLLLVSILAFQKREHQVFAWSNALLYFARPEGIVWMTMAFCFDFKQRRFAALKSWSLPAALIVTWTIFLFAYFGTIIPHGAVAKTKIYPKRPIIATTLELTTVISNFVAPLKLQPNSHPLREYAAIKSLHKESDYALVLFFGSAVLGTLIFIGWQQPWMRLYAAGVVAITAFFAATNPSMFPWYYSWFALLPMLLGPSLAAMVATRLQGAISVVLSLSLGAYLLAVPIIQSPYQVRGLPLPVFVWESHQQRLLSLLKATQWIKETYGDGSQLAVLEPGIIGYYYEGRILDLDGLISDEMLRYYPLKPNSLPSGVIINIPVQSIHDLSPTWLVFFDRIGYHLRLDPDFNARYKLEKQYPVEFGEFRKTCVYRLKG